MVAGARRGDQGMNVVYEVESGRSQIAGWNGLGSTAWHRLINSPLMVRIQELGDLEVWRMEMDLNMESRKKQEEEFVFGGIVKQSKGLARIYRLYQIRVHNRVHTHTHTHT
ncbi:hypothetical protein L1887_00809 [Cichorium endivia]|nr:hypothetical protein L1887_00809 [Cichorium endivia]